MPVQTTVDRVASVLASIRELSRSRVMVGIPEERGSRREGTISNAQIGYIHEYGAPEAGIPPRPHRGPGVRAVQPEITRRLRAAGEAALEGRQEAMRRGLNAAGLVAVNSIRAVITAGLKPPLAESTLAGRRRRGRTGEKPLLDTGQYRNAITYVIRRVK